MAELDHATIFRDAVRDHGALVARIVSSYEARSDIAEELVHEAFAALWRALPTFRAESSLRTLLARIAQNVSVSHVRKAVPVSTRYSAPATKMRVFTHLSDDEYARSAEVYVVIRPRPADTSSQPCVISIIAHKIFWRTSCPPSWTDLRGIEAAERWANHEVQPYQAASVCKRRYVKSTPPLPL